VLLNGAGFDLGVLRRAALDSLGAPPDLAPIVMPPLTPAGTLDRPPLPVEQLDARGWMILCWRQEHLPLDRLRGKGDWHALSSLEQRAAWRVADRCGLDVDQRYSMLVQHHNRVETLAHAARPQVVETWQQLKDRHGQGGSLLVHGRYRWRRFVPNFMVGWPTWFANRRAGLRDKRFWLMTWSTYRGQPRPNA
jgi:hypothetical protein